MRENFTKTIKSGGIEREFKFIKVFYGSEPWYHISFIQNNKREEFRMYKNEHEEWKISDSILPSWIFESECDFSNALEENSKS